MRRVDSGKSWRNGLLAAFTLFYGVYFVSLMLRGLRSWFSGDDLQNIYYAWSRPLGDLIRGNILFFNHYPRPMGELLLYGLYSASGLQPGAFNGVRLVICVLNVVVLYVFAAQLARSREVGVLTVMLVGFNAQLFSVYYDSGMFFDALAFLFFYSGIALYCYYRRGGRILSFIQGLQVVLLCIAALDSKEISVSFPVALFLYELTAGETLSLRALVRRCPVPFVTALLTAVYIVGKNSGADALSATSAYHPNISLSVYINTYAHYAGEFVLRSGSLSVTLMASTLAGQPCSRPFAQEPRACVGRAV